MSSAKGKHMLAAMKNISKSHAMEGPKTDDEYQLSVPSLNGDEDTTSDKSFSG